MFGFLRRKKKEAEQSPAEVTELNTESIDIINETPAVDDSVTNEADISPSAPPAQAPVAEEKPQTDEPQAEISTELPVE